MHTQHGPTLLDQHCRITGSLGALQLSEAIAAAGDQQIGARLTGDLEEDPVRMTALVILAGRMQIAGTEAERRLHPCMSGHERTQLHRLGVGDPIEVSLDSDIPVLVDLGEELLQSTDEIGGFIDDLEDVDGSLTELRLLGRTGIRSVEQVPGLSLRRFHIGLVEGIDADAVTGDGRGVFPEQEQLTQAAGERGLETGGRTQLRVIRRRAEQAQQGVRSCVGEADVRGGVDDDGKDALPVLAE